jgi:rsbT co-antagonist protein RsbR
MARLQATAKAREATVQGGIAPRAPEPPTTPQSPASTKRLRLTAADIERRKRLVDLGHEDLVRILAVKTVVVENADKFTDGFFDFLSHLDEAAPLIKNRSALEEAKKLKREHIIAMAQGECDIAYAEQRLELGMLYGKVGLDVTVFLGAFHHLMRLMGSEIMKRFSKNPMTGFESFMSLKKLAFFDLALIVDVIIDERERTISAQ